MLEAWSGVASPMDACEEVAIGPNMADSDPSGPSRSSTQLEGRGPKATDSSFLPGMLYCERGAEVTENVCYNCSKAPWRCRLRMVVMSHGGLTARREWHLCEAGSLRFCATQYHL